jgi:hypothetical protein
MKPVLLALAAALAVSAIACGDDDEGGGNAVSVSATATPACGTESGQGCAPESERVDLEEPVFTNPTEITNPLFPVSQAHSLVMLGTDEGEPFRAEVTLLPETKTIEWNGNQIQTLASQYASYLDGRLAEIAVDWYAQADDGSVWYFGEDVFNYEDGELLNTEGTWLAGKDGPPGMIMPADPQVGDVYRPENSPGIVFEEVTVKSTGETIEGPRGPVEGAIVVQELLADGTTEEKTFAPGYGEFSARTPEGEETVAISVITDALAQEMPSELQTMETAAEDVFETARSGDWDGAAINTATLTAAWDAHKAAVDVPPLLQAEMDNQLQLLTSALGFKNPIDTQQAAIDAEKTTLDMQLQYLPPTTIDVGRLELLTKQVLVDAADNEEADVASDIGAMEWVRNRFVRALDATVISQVDGWVRDLRTAIAAEDLGAVQEAAAGLREAVAAHR